MPNISMHNLHSLSYAPTHLRYQNFIPSRNAHGHSLALLIERPWTDGEDFRLIQFLDRTLREEDPGCRLGFGLYALDEYPVEEGGKGGYGFEGGSLGGSSVSLGEFEIWTQRVKVTIVMVAWKGVWLKRCL